MYVRCGSVPPSYEQLRFWWGAYGQSLGLRISVRGFGVVVVDFGGRGDGVVYEWDW